MSGERPVIESVDARPPTVGETLLVTVCKLEPGRVAALLPAPLEAARDEAFFYLVWATLNSTLYPIHHRSFLEANIALPCHGPRGEGTWFLRAYFPGRHMVRHAVLSGWTGEQADVSVGRVPAAVQRLVWPPRHPIGGWVGRDGTRLFEMTLDVAAAADIATSPLHRFNRVYGVRTLGGRRDVTFENHVGEDRIVRFQAADARLEVNEELSGLLGPLDVQGGYLAELGIVLGGSAHVGSV